MLYDISDTTSQEIKDGFTYDEKSEVFSCLFCTSQFESGGIYSVDERLVDAQKAIRLHIREVHGSVFHMLLKEDKRHTGLTDVQKTLLASFYDGKSDADIAGETDTSKSTVRYQRFFFREKARQAKMLCALSDLLEEKLGKDSGDVSHPHRGATMVDERYCTTDDEIQKITRSYFHSLTPPILKSFPTKEKNKIVVLKIVAGRFEPSKKYAEREVNEILKAVFDDFATIRRYLIEYGFMERTIDCAEYWRK